MTAQWQPSQWDLIENNSIVGTVNRMPTGEFYATLYPSNGEPITELGWTSTLEAAQDMLQLAAWERDLAAPEPLDPSWNSIVDVYDAIAASEAEGGTL
jgi:hypothetical protein